MYESIGGVLVGGEAELESGGVGLEPDARGARERGARLEEEGEGEFVRQHSAAEHEREEGGGAEAGGSERGGGVRADEGVDEEGVDRDGGTEERGDEGLEQRGRRAGGGREEPCEDERVGVQAGLEEEGEGLEDGGRRGGARQKMEAVLLRQPRRGWRVLRRRHCGETAASQMPWERRWKERRHLVERMVLGDGAVRL